VYTTSSQRPDSVHTTFPQRLYSVQGASTERKQLLQRIHGAHTARIQCSHGDRMRTCELSVHGGLWPKTSVYDLITITYTCRARFPCLRVELRTPGLARVRTRYQGNQLASIVRVNGARGSCLRFDWRQDTSGSMVLKAIVRPRTRRLDHAWGRS